MIKRTTINAYQVGLVFEKGKLTNVLEAGSYWIFGNKEVKIYEMKQSFEKSKVSLSFRCVSN